MGSKPRSPSSEKGRNLTEPPMLLISFIGLGGYKLWKDPGKGNLVKETN